MALGRAMLKGMNLTEEQVSAIIEAHTETVNALKEQRDEYRANAERAAALQSELDSLKGGKDWKSEHDTLKQQFDAYRQDVESKAALSVKQSAFRKLLTDEKIPAKYHDRIIKMTDFSGVELEGDAIKDESACRESIKSNWGEFVATEKTEGDNPQTPPPTDNKSDTYKDIRDMAAKWHAAKYGEPKND